VYRVTDLQSLDCWYGLIYTRNDSKLPLKEAVNPILSGLEVVSPTEKQANGSYLVELAPGEDHVFILKRTEGGCSFKLSSQLMVRP
jgi:hypothetical protein